MNNNPTPTPQLQLTPSYYYSHYDVINLISQKQYTEISQSLTHSTQSAFPPQTWGSLLINHLISPSLQTFSNLLSYSTTSASSYTKTNIQILNHIFLHFHLSNYNNVIRLFLSNIPVHSQHSYIFLTNALLVLLDIAITTNNLSLSLKLLKAFETLLTPSSVVKSASTTSTPDQSVTSYLNNIEIFNATWSKFTELVHIYKCFVNIELNNVVQARKNLYDFKCMFRASSVVEDTTKRNLHKRVKHIYTMLKIKLDYISNTHNKCVKHLTALINKGGDCDYGLAYYYNVHGVLNLKNGKPTVARLWFMKCLATTQRNVALMLRFGKMVMFNVGLCLFAVKDYKGCLKIMRELMKEEWGCKRAFVLYRAGVCLVEDDNAKGNVEEGALCFKTAMNVVEKKLFKSKSGSGSSDVYEELEGMLMNESVFNMKNKGSKRCSSQNGKQHNNSGNSSNSMNNSGDNSNSIYKQTYVKVYMQCYLNLLYCLSCMNKHTEVIYYINRLYVNIKQYDITTTTTTMSLRDLQSITNNYLINAYIHLNHPSKALALLKQSLTLTSLSPSFKHNIIINYITHSITTSNYIEALTHIKHLITEHHPTSSPPSYIYDIVLYYLLSTNNTSTAIHVLTRHQLPHFINNSN